MVEQFAFPKFHQSFRLLHQRQAADCPLRFDFAGFAVQSPQRVYSHSRPHHPSNIAPTNCPGLFRDLQLLDLAQTSIPYRKELIRMKENLVHLFLSQRCSAPKATAPPPRRLPVGEIIPSPRQTTDHLAALSFPCHRPVRLKFSTPHIATTSTQTPSLPGQDSFHAAHLS